MASAAKKRRAVLNYVPAPLPEGPLELAAPASDPLVVALAIERLRVAANYAFYDDEGAFKAWPEGQIVTDPEEIQLLTERGAPVERVLV